MGKNVPLNVNISIIPDKTHLEESLNGITFTLTRVFRRNRQSTWSTICSADCRPV
jgi:hypothetical protein